MEGDQMIISGRVWKDGSTWIIECPTLGAVTEGTSKANALMMMVDWVQSMTFEDAAPILALIAKQPLKGK